MVDSKYDLCRYGDQISTLLMNLPTTSGPEFIAERQISNENCSQMVSNFERQVATEVKRSRSQNTLLRNWCHCVPV